MTVAMAIIFAAGTAFGQTVADLTRKMELLGAYPELIVVNGKISTIDSSNREVQALAVKNNRIIALGTNDEMRFLAGPRTEVLDAKGRRVLPGLIDGHTHPHLWAVEHRLGAEGDITAKRYNDPQLKIVYARGNDGATVLRNTERLVRERAQELGPNKWIWVGLFGGNSIPESREITYPLFTFEDGRPSTLTRQFLDTLAPNNPLMLMASEAIGPAANNTKAKEEMVKYLGTEVQGLSARNSVTYDILFRGRLDDKADFLKRELLECVAAQGITTFSNHYYNSPSIMQTFNLLYQRGEMPVRWGWWVGGGLAENVISDPAREREFAKLFYNDLGDFRGIGNDFIWNVGVANEGWEGGLNCTKVPKTNVKMPTSKVARILRDGAMKTSCSDEMVAKYDEQTGYTRVKAAVEAGLRVGFLHHYSDGTFDALFHLLDEQVKKGNMTVDQIRALRISTEHTPMIRPDQVETIAKYNIMPAFNGYQLQGDIKGGAFLKAFGEQYMTWMAPMKSLMDKGAHPVFNTDAHLSKNIPVYAKDMDYPEQWDGNIWGFIEFFVTRKMPHDGITYNRSEAMDRVNMMRAATIWAAEQILNEKNIGSLEVGKLADFIVLDKDFFTIQEDQIKTIKTLLTATGGKVVFKDSAY